MYLATCFKKLFCSPIFLLSVAAAAVICMFSELYHSTRSGTEKTVIEMYLQYTRSAMLSDVGLCSYTVFVKGFGNWVAMFVPVIVSISSISIFIDERKSGVWRYALHRTGRIRYGIGGCFFILLSGGLALTLGYALFGILAAIMFPPLSAFPEESADFFVEMNFSRGTAMAGIYQSGGLPLCVAAQLAETFFYGMVCSAAAMLLSAVCENKYVIICTPFFLKYALNQLSIMLSLKAIDDSADLNRWLMNFAQIINPDAAKSFLNNSGDPLAAVIVNAAYLLILSVIFCAVHIRRLKNET